MKLSQLFTINAILFIAFGIAFSLYSPLMMNFFAVPELQTIDSSGYWLLASFARMFGAALFGFGLLLWALRGAVDQASPEAKRGLVFALLLAYLLGAIISATQQASIWQGPAGWIATGVFVVFLLAYGYFLGTSGHVQQN
jgi:hypothetical protein